MMRKSHAVAFAAALTLAGCASVPPRDVTPHVQAAVAIAGAGDPRLPMAGESYLPERWFAEPMTVEFAVQAALLNNPRARAQLARLDAARAERVQAGLLANPIASLMALRPTGGGRVELDLGLVQDLYNLLSRSRRVALADAQQRRTEAEVVGELAALAADTQAAYFALQAAQQRLQLKRDQAELGRRELDLVQREVRAGVLDAASALTVAAADAMRSHEVGGAEAGVARARADLARLLGLASAQSVALVPTWPDLPLGGLDSNTLQRLAAAHRPELRVAAAAVDEARAQRELQTGALRRTLPSLGAAATREVDGQRRAGPSLSLVLPVFDRGATRRSLADARLAEAGYTEQAVQREVPLAVETALAQLASAQSVSEHTALHLRQQVQLETLAAREYAAGIIGLRDMLAARQARLDAAMVDVDATDALYADWVALQRATGTAQLHGDD